MRLIDADTLRAAMYHEAFETDTNLQRWDSGCWIRFKMFENIIDDVPTIDAVPVVRCKDCKHLHLEKGICNCVFSVPSGPDGYCSYGEIKEERK